MKKEKVKEAGNEKTEAGEIRGTSNDRVDVDVLVRRCLPLVCFSDLELKL